MVMLVSPLTSVDLADRKLAPSGTLALVLPLSAMSGSSWDGVRELWRNSYSDILVVTIAAKGLDSKSFSADTGMAECLFKATKTATSNPQNRANFTILDRRPESVLEGELFAQAIGSELATGSVIKLEDGPLGGTRIVLGEAFVGEVVDCPLPTEGAWQMVGISDVSLGQTAYQLCRGRLWIQGMAIKDVPDVPVATIGEICRRNWASPSGYLRIYNQDGWPAAGAF